MILVVVVVVVVVTTYIVFFSGNVRRIQYTFNTTDPTVYQPPPCVIDWPKDTFSGQVEWNIGHCPNLTEAVYDVVVSAWNPLDGWISSQVTQVEVLERIGPIHIDDYLIVTDHVCGVMPRRTFFIPGSWTDMK